MILLNNSIIRWTDPIFIDTISINPLQKESDLITKLALIINLSYSFIYLVCSLICILISFSFPWLNMLSLSEYLLHYLTMTLSVEMFVILSYVVDQPSI